MDCVNHPGVHAAAYCQNCGKPMCAECVRQEPGGQILCEPCWTARQSARTAFAEVPMDGPNPVVAALLGILPGVGAMYNGQFLKGFIHVAIFAALVSATGHFGLFGLFIAAWVIYQVFEAYHTARARRDGEPLPDPLGLNELAGWFHTGVQSEFRRSQGAAADPAAGGPAAGPSATQAPPASGFAPSGGFAPPYSMPGQNPYQGGYQPPPFAGYPPAGGYPPGGGYAAGYQGGYPPVPPAPPAHWRRREPLAAILLIALGVMFLLGQWDWISGRLFEYGWPVLLIGLGLWLIIRRMQDVPHPGPMPPGVPPGSPGAASHGVGAQDAEKESRGDSL